MHRSLATVICVVALCGCGSNAASNSNARFEEQADAFDRQLERSLKGIAKQESLMKRAEELQDRNERIADTNERLLKKWEEQLLRADAILDAHEKEAGITP